jgi:5S rRNA maturation endonuclease (ribonuclease M5)
MKFNPELKAGISAYLEYVIIVEGKKDVASLNSLGFRKVYALHETGVPIRVRVEQIMQKINKSDKICILTDLDKKGKKLYMLAKQVFQELGAHLDSSFRGLLIKAQLTHIEGLASFMEKIGKI